MGCWGMGITQSDEYCEIYERFMVEYDEGKPLAEIKQDILEEYLTEFDENDGVLHDVYFALGKAEWICGGISEDIFGKISHIISTGENIAFYRELEATERDLKLRKKNLEKFLASLSIPRGKTKKRRIPTEKYVRIEKPKLPPFQCGDVFAYKVDGKYRLMCLLTREIFYTSFASRASFCYIWARFFDQVPTVEELTDEYVIPLGRFTAETFPRMEKLIFVGNRSDMIILDDIYVRSFCALWKPAERAIAKEVQLTEEYPAEYCVKLSDCLNKAYMLKESARMARQETF
ncbi:MAG: hypothetical protein E7464_06515 [Ruminococcaceae bacterium]|nr:hypothetical protein [Oscillospiraceae bacterium]